MLLYMDLTGSILIALTLLLRLRRLALPPAFLVILWDAAIARLLVPLMLPAPFSLDTLWPKASAALPGTAVQSGLWLWVWAAGAAASAALFLFRYLSEWRVLREALPLDADFRERIAKSGVSAGRIQLLTSDRISTPAAGGLLRPRVVLPKSAAGWDLRTTAFVLTHELTHIRRADTLQKLLLAVAVCVHWFNPLVWVMQKCMDRDLEKACDDRVVAAFGEQSRCEYADTLLALAAERPFRTALSNGFGASAVRERILSILHVRRSPAALCLAAALMLICSAAAFASGPPAAVKTAPELEGVFYVYDAAGSPLIVTGSGGFWEAEAAMPGATSVSVAEAGLRRGQLQITIDIEDPPSGALTAADKAGSAG
ncbi:MAG: M56 family metallopeptidase [Clostridia bacterium]|nr:M56 family metallopeptidase [Clostridia bacterium]